VLPPLKFLGNPLLSDTTVGNFGENAKFNTFSPVFWSKIAIFGRKMAFFMILNFYLLPASASLCDGYE
jgi:hypothetical protein